MKRKLLPIVLITLISCDLIACSEKQSSAVPTEIIEETSVLDTEAGATTSAVMTEIDEVVNTEIEEPASWVDQYQLDTTTDFSFTLDGVSYGYPMTPKQFLQNGWTVMEDDVDKVVNAQMGDQIVVEKDHSYVYLGIINIDAQSNHDATDCYITSVSVKAGDSVSMQLNSFDVELGADIEVTHDMFGDKFAVQENPTEMTEVYVFNEDDPTTGYQVGGFVLCVEEGKLNQIIVYANAFGSDFGG